MLETYGDTAKVIRSALEMAQRRQHINNLVEIISDIKKNLELLEEDKAQGLGFKKIMPEL